MRLYRVMIQLGGLDFLDMADAVRWIQRNYDCMQVGEGGSGVYPEGASVLHVYGRAGRRPTPCASVQWHWRDPPRFGRGPACLRLTAEDRPDAWTVSSEGREWCADYLDGDGVPRPVVRDGVARVRGCRCRALPRKGLSEARGGNRRSRTCPNASSACNVASTAVSVRCP